MTNQLLLLVTFNSLLFHRLGKGVLTEAQKALAQIADLPCVDEADMYFCFFEIIMKESCTNNIVKEF
ncbi:hypothetical protein P5673_010449 [Acropora cervicornis]|uniref:Uncharacterized protein n=1 Tax=Acropora cervicornis TaxID=6130 RepID=A0AAD9QQR3_ACRCE|nr:hypothetical protein P5673_010449 [Acropora cervicornis]